MLTLTDNAVLVIRDLTAQQEAPDAAGLRIASDPTGSLTLALAEQPQRGDQVLNTAGARIFLDEESSHVLRNKALDAAVDAQGVVQFGIAELPTGTGRPIS
jgi:Fe-S cluster assembly iron-binding protein IscA